MRAHRGRQVRVYSNKREYTPGYSTDARMRAAIKDAFCMAVPIERAPLIRFDSERSALLARLTRKEKRRFDRAVATAKKHKAERAAARLEAARLAARRAGAVTPPPSPSLRARRAARPWSRVRSPHSPAVKPLPMPVVQAAAVPVPAAAAYVAQAPGVPLPVAAPLPSPPRFGGQPRFDLFLPVSAFDQSTPLVPLPDPAPPSPVFDQGTPLPALTSADDGALETWLAAMTPRAVAAECPACNAGVCPSCPDCGNAKNLDCTRNVCLCDFGQDFWGAV